MVLRGSKTAPEGSIVENVQTVKQAGKQVAALHHQIEEVAAAGQQLHTVESIATQRQLEEIRDVVDLLHRRIEELEKREKDAETARAESQKALIRTSKQLFCGGAAGAIARSIVAPIDRVKILRQTQHITLQGAGEKYTSIWSSLKLIAKEEGVARLWRGNATNIVRVAPYSATQFASYDFYKRKILGTSGDAKLSVPQRLLAGAFAGMTATTITHPLDVIRLRLSVQPELKGANDAFRSVWAEGRFRALFKGYVPTLLSLSPFIAVNFASFDLLKQMAYPRPGEAQNPLVILSLGATAGIVAQTICYPLDTVRRRMQMKGKVYNSTADAFRTIAKTEGFSGFYKGMVPNAVKVLPNNAIRFMVFEWLKKSMGMTGGEKEGGGGGGM